MGPDGYRVEILHYLNPYLIWVEITDSRTKGEDYVFEQVGIYGILPLKTTIDDDCDGIQVSISEDWPQAASLLMKNFLHSAVGVYFAPTYIDRRSSIFDDNIHKYGELIIIRKDGTEKCLSHYLEKTGLATRDECLFHQNLSAGKLKTKLNLQKTTIVIHEIEKNCLKIEKQKKSIRKHATLACTAHHVVSSLTVQNVQRLNTLRSENFTVEDYLQNKLKDIELCRDVDDDPIGRGVSKESMVSTKVQMPSTCSSRRSLLKSRLKMESEKDVKTQKILQAAKNLLVANAVTKPSKTPVKSPSFSSESEMSIKIEDSPVGYDKNNYDEEHKEEPPAASTAKTRSLKELSRIKKYLKTIGKSNEIEPDIRIDDENKNNQNYEVRECIPENPNQKTANKIENVEKRESFDNAADENQFAYNMNEENKQNTNEVSPLHQSRRETKINKSPHKLPDYDPCTHISIAMGPPETKPTDLLVKIVPRKVITAGIKADTQSKKNTETMESQIPMPKNEDTFASVDSHIGMEITNKETIKKLHEKAIKNLTNVEVKRPGAGHEETAIDNNSEEKLAKPDTPLTDVPDSSKVRKSPKLPANTEPKKNDSSSEDVKKPNSFLKKKLLLHKQSMAKHNTSAESDTSTKDSSSNIEADKPKECSQQHTELDSDDESTSEILQKMNSEYPDTKIPLPKEIIELAAAMKNNVNPFKNVDANISVFVEKLVTPVLMVHTKFDNRIQPVFELRDVPFNTHIQVMLKNMCVQKPMILQSVSWSSILRGRSMFLISPAGSGKTMGYLPAVCRLVTDGNLDKYSTGPLCIIVCATAQAVAHVERMSKAFLSQKDKVFACHPGMNELHLLTSILNGCDLLICTPSVLVRLLKNNEFGVDLRRLMTFVLDDCERLSEVYSSEIKFFLLKIKEALKSRVDKLLKVQYVLASRIWCDFMEPLAKRAPNSLISIGAFQECVLYAKANMTASFVPEENKINCVFDFLKETDTSKKTVIVCRSNEEVVVLENALKQTKHVVFACNSTMTVHDLYNISLAWNDYQEPTKGPILVCCDGNLLHLNVTDAHYLIHYSLPQLFSLFCKRFSVLNENYASIFKDANAKVKIKILIDDTNVEQLPKIMHFIKRCREDVPKVLEEICERVMEEKDAMKGQNMIPICDNLLAYGECPDYWNCRERHVIFKDHDAPKHWMPKNGVITFKIIHYHTAIFYSARLLCHIVKGEIVKYPQLYTKLSMKISTYYAKESNKRLHGIPKVGDYCAVALKQNLFVRCQVVKILTYYQNGNPNYVIVKLIDEEKYERTRDIYLYHLPDEMKQVETHVVMIRMANIQPKDKDVTFSELALNKLKHVTDTNDDLYFRGEIALTVGNCIFVYNLETCRDLSSMNETVVRHNFKQELEPYAVPKCDHMPKLEKMCLDSGLPIEKIEEVIESPKRRPLPKARWAHLEKDDVSAVFFSSADDPGTFFVRLVKFEDCMNVLIKDIQKHVAENPNIITEIQKGDIVLAKCPDDEYFERARIEEIGEDKVKCFFVDQGDWGDVSKNHLSPITEKFITQLPFQAIECRLIGVEPPGDEWTEFSINWFINCFEDSDLKQVYAKYFTKEIPLHTGGHKYGVVLIDTSTDQDVIINDLILEVNLAKEDENEIEYLKNLNFERKSEKPESSDEDSDWEKVSEPKSTRDIAKSEQKVPLDKVFLKQPIRSVPLVGSDDSDIDNIDFNMSNEFMHLFKPMMKATNSTFPAIGERKVKKTDALSDSDISIVKSVHSNDIEFNSVLNKETEIIGNVDQQSDDNNFSKDLDNSVNKNMLSNKQDKSFNYEPKKTILNKLSKNLNTSLDSDDLSSPELSKIIENSDNAKSSASSSTLSATCEHVRPATEQIKVSEVKLHTEDNRIPKLVWRQTNADVFIKIQLIGADKYNLEITDKHLKFDAVVDDIKYGLEFELYGVVDKLKSTHSNKGQYILVNLKKKLKKNWLMLNWDGPKKYIVYDVDHIEESSSEEEVVGQRADLVKRLKNVSDSESDEDFVDDSNYVYKRYVD